MIIDFHNHYYPPEYLDELAREPGHYRVTKDDAGNPVLHSPGDANFIVPGHRDVAFREEVLQQTGVDMQVLTFTAPGTAMESPARAAALCRVVNDALAAAARERPERYKCLATLPMQDPKAAVSEFERATKQLGMPGAMLFSNASGVPLSDVRFWPLYERASETRTVLYIHPTYPLGVEAMEEYWLMPIVGFPMDTTLAAASLVFSGVVERFAGIRWVLGHLGGAVPYLAERFDRGYHAYHSCRENISRPPTDYLKDFYYDTVNFDPAALEFALGFAGPERLVAGSDYPHHIGSLEQMVSSIGEMAISDEDRARILGGNAAELLGVQGTGA